jgi:hypothetical protein
MSKVNTQIAFLVLALLAQNAVSIFAFDQTTGQGSGSAAIIQLPSLAHQFEVAQANSIAQHGLIRREKDNKSCSDDASNHRAISGRNGARFSSKTIYGTPNSNRQASVTFPIFRHKNSHRHQKSNRSTKNTQRDNGKVAALEAANAKLNLELKAAQKDLANAQKNNADLKAQNEALARKIPEIEGKLKFVAVLEKKLQDAEKLIYELKANSDSQAQEVNAWKHKFEFAARKIAEYEETIKRLSAEVAELKSKTSNDSDSKRGLELALAKVDELRKALDHANERLRYFAALQHKYTLPSQQEKSRKEHSRKEPSRRQPAKKEASRKRNDNEFRTIKITPTVSTQKSNGKTTVVVGEELAE